MNNNLLRVDHLKKYFPIKKGLFSKTVDFIHAVEDISFAIGEKETFGLVGETGSGKSTVGRCVLRLIQPTEGTIMFNGENILDLKEKEMRKRRRDMQIIFQDPYSSLNPRMTVGKIVEEPLIVHGLGSKKERRERVKELLKRVGLDPSAINRYPHEFSGGQRQRIGIARALSLNPRFIVCDEPVSALDVSVQAQVINLLEDIQGEMNIAYLFIAHGLNVVAHISKRVGVMYLGNIVETGLTDEIYFNPLHPYTKALLSANPIADPDAKRDRIILQGDIPSPANPPSGCRFHTRCPIAEERCKIDIPTLNDKGNNHFVSCHLIK